MAVDERLVTCVRFALAVQFGARSFEPAASPLDFSAYSRADLLFRVFLIDLSNSGIDWRARDSPRQRISASVSRAVRPRELLVCANAAVVFEQRAHAQRNLLGGNDRL